MRSLINTFRRSFSVVRESSELTKILQSELKHEKTSIPHYLSKKELGSLGNFTLDWDNLKFQDVVLRRKDNLGEEIAVSALLGPPVFEEDEEGALFPYPALMKVCIKKPGLSSILQFHCGITGKTEGGSEFSIHGAYYLPSSSSLGDSVYRGPLFSSLDPQLQEALKDYLIAKGIVEDFTDFLLHHLHKKENVQYVGWLQKLESYTTV